MYELKVCLGLCILLGYALLGTVSQGQKVRWVDQPVWRPHSGCIFINDYGVAFKPYKCLWLRKNGLFCKQLQLVTQTLVPSVHEALGCANSEHKALC